MKVERPMLNTTAVCELCILVLTISVECWLLLFMCNEVARSHSNWWHRWSIFSTFQENCQEESRYEVRSELGHLCAFD